MTTFRRNDIFCILFKAHDEISLEEAFALGNRQPQSKEKNRQWIGYNLARWRKRGLVEGIYGTTVGAYGVLTGIRLTELGKTLLGKPTEPNQQNNPAPTADILEMVRQCKRAHPEWEITFEIRLKDHTGLPSATEDN